MKSRVLILHRGLVAMVIPLTLFLDMVPSSSADVTRRVELVFSRGMKMGRVKTWEYFWTVLIFPDRPDISGGDLK